MTDCQLTSKMKRSPMKNYKVVPREDKPKRVPPSVYNKEMLQTTEERLANTNTVHPPCILKQVNMRDTEHIRPLFQPYPSELVFQNYKSAQTYKLSLLLCNKDKNPQHLKLKTPESRYFHVTGPNKAGGKIPPGMCATFDVSFTPQENKDYHYTLVFVTEKEQFEVPVIAIGARGILDFPDKSQLPTCPVKSSTEKTLLAFNVGTCTAKFTLHTKKPFSVTPSCGTLDVGKNMQVTVTFNPMTVGVHSQELILHYHTGEDVYICLQGICEELDVYFEPNSVLLESTYISLSSVQKVSIRNSSQIPLQYRWTTWPSLQEEARSLSRDSSVLQQRGEEEAVVLQSEAEPAVIHGVSLRSRALQAVQDHCLLLPHSCMTVQPQDGEIWPPLKQDFLIVFKPEEAKLYEQTIYCDITGRESQLPLTIKGQGLGPKLEFQYNLMNIKDVVIGQKMFYEVPLSNKGLIDAQFTLSRADTTFGRCFSLHPDEGVVPSGACQIVGVTFQGRMLGTFSEDLLLSVKGQPEPLTLTFSGTVTGPKFHCSVSELNFGDVACGFPAESVFYLYNKSYVPVKFSLRVLGDGLGPPSVTWKTLLSVKSEINWQPSATRDIHAKSAEFTISPDSGSVPLLSNTRIKVVFCANAVERCKLKLAVDIEDVGEEIITLPINARCVVPDIVVETTSLDFQRCFLNHQYEQQARLTNNSSRPACYCVLDQESEEDLSLCYGSTKPRGVIFPHSSEEIPVFLVAKDTGRLHQTLRIAIFCSTQPPLEVALSCIGQGPVVHVDVPHLDFGGIQVLMDHTRILRLSNQSPIPAHFTTHLNCTKSIFHVEPDEGEIKPESSTELRVVAHLKDTVDFEGSLEISIQHSPSYTVLLSATGTGTTIVSDRPFAPSLDLGTYFSHESCQYHFKLTNHGLRTQRLHWKTSGSLRSPQASKKGFFSGHTVLPPISGTRKKDTPGQGSVVVSANRDKPVFSLSPSYVQLSPGCSVDMVLMGSSDSPKVVRERLMCDTMVGHPSTYQCIMSVDVTCHFVDIMLSITPKQMNFITTKVLGESLTPLYEKLILTNTSSLSLSLEVSVVEPFSLFDSPGAHCSATTKSMVLGDGRQSELWVCFNPSYHLDQVSRVEDKFLEIHYEGCPKQERVKLHAEVHFPNLRFSSTTVDFGCVLNDTKAEVQISITNDSSLPVSYCWDFLDEQKSRETQMQEVEEEQRDPENEGEEGRSSSCTASSAFSDPLSPRLGADELCSTQSTVDVFDIFPKDGHLQPGDMQLVTLSFYGHANVSREVMAQCHVEEGPTYKVQLRGEASVINYSLDYAHIDFGQQLFDHIAKAVVTLKNTGKVGFEFCITDAQRESEAKVDVGDALLQNDQEENEKEHGVRPGQPMVIPAKGFISAGAEGHLHVLYLPGIPEVFERHLQLRVAHMPPQDIALTGEGVFPRTRLSLPQNLSDECYSAVVQQARAAVEADKGRLALTDGVTTAGGAPTRANSTLTYEERLHMEIEKTLVKENALAVTASLLELRHLQSSPRKWHKLSKFQLPEYILDFGCIPPGKIPSHTVNVTNTGSVPVSLDANIKPLAGSGFSVDFKSMKNLPCGETHSFTVKFDPHGANLEEGPISVVMPIEVTCGPTVQVRLSAVVTVPTITVSTNALHFDTVQCGMCQIQTIQLHNPSLTPCSWSIAKKVKPLKKANKFLPPHLRKKDFQVQQPLPAVFEMIPSSGMLSPGEQGYVQIKFSPAEGHSYSRQLVLRVTESTQEVSLTVEGLGVEPHLEFSTSVLELGPCLPCTTDVEAEVTIKNPCSFPIEFYSLELDTQYIKEEKMLQLMPGYENNKLLLPPRAAGESLQREVLNYYEEFCSELRDDVESITASVEPLSSPSEDTPSEEVTRKKEMGKTPDGRRTKKCKVTSPASTQVAEPKENRQLDTPQAMQTGAEQDGQAATAGLEGDTELPMVEGEVDSDSGPNDPAIPPPVIFSVIPFPKDRQQSNSNLTCDCFTFLLPPRPEGEEEEKKEEQVQPAASKRGKGRALTRVSSKTACLTSPEDQHSFALTLKRKQSLSTFRWVVPANGEVVLKIWFYSEDSGLFEQVFNFELLGTQRPYQLLCRAACNYPSICQDPMTIFALCEKVEQVEGHIQKTYVIKDGYFEFGPLLCGKTRDRYKENKYPENMQQLVISNNSGLEVEVHFTFQYDTQATTYLLDPPAMTLKPDQKQELTVWAYPTKRGQIKDTLVCTIKDNSELVIINLSCWGVWPQLKLESSTLNFSKMLVNRRYSRSLTLHNKTALPVSWRLHGVEELGDEFTVPQDEGVVSPNSSFLLDFHFLASNPLHIKKTLRLEVSDVGKILGIVHTENVQVVAEAYDVALEISSDLDFGTVKVLKETSQSLIIKNQGKYEIAYKFTVQETNSIFTISPHTGSLLAHKPPTTVQVTCKPTTEVSIREQPLLSCQVIEPSIGTGGETVAIIPIKVSVKSVFTRYKITPACEIDFGTLVHGSEKSLNFVIENNGVFETNFTIYHMITEHPPSEKPVCPGKRNLQESHLVRATNVSRVKHTQNHLNTGVFSVSPCTGSLQPGSHQVVTVLCTAGLLGSCNQGLFIDFSDLDHSDQPEGVPYRLLAEVCKLGIELDMASIFEEHRLCRSSTQLSSEPFCSAKGIYVLDENKFIFNKVLVGQTAQARLKFTNAHKVPCSLTLAIKGAMPSSNVECFDVSARTLSIPSQSHSFAVVTFTPQMTQHYGAVFQATVKGINRLSSPCKVEFDLTGEGYLPSVCVLRPALRSGSHSPTLQFRRGLVGRRQTLPLVLLNDGSGPAEVQIDLVDKHAVFSFSAAPDNTCCTIHCTQIDGNTDTEHSLMHAAILKLDESKQVEFEVSFCSDKPLSVEASMSLQVMDNKYRDTIIAVSAAAYQETVSLDNLSRSSQEGDQEDNDGCINDVLNFGDCQVDSPSQESFTMTNHSSSQAMKFEWPAAGSHVSFSPQVGHLHAGCSKEVTVTFCSSQPVTLTNQLIRCKVSQVEFQQPIEQVADWDDRNSTAQRLTSSKVALPQQHVKNKVLETEPEPCCSEVKDSQWELELRVSAVCGYVKFSCDTDSIHFKDTLLYQASVHHLKMVNNGNVKLEFSLQVLMDAVENTINHDQRDEISRRDSRSSGVLTGAQPASSLLKRNPERPPISVEPSQGAIEPGAMQDFCVCFSPLEVAQFHGRLVYSIPNLQEGDHAPCISVCGCSLLPHCHFDLEDSEYIGGRPELKRHLDPDTRIIELCALGLSVPSTRRFNVLNPTSEPFSFKWKCEDTVGSAFSCLNPCGTVPPGKKVEVCFQYVPEQLDAVESIWSFVIDSVPLSIPFLCVGNTREPHVYLDRSHIDFGEVLVGHKVKQTVDLVNGEEEPMQFSVVQSSLLSNDQQSSLGLQPLTGTVAPQDRLPLFASLKPCREGHVSFQLVLKVKRKSELLTLPVKAECSTISTAVQVQEPGGGLRETDPDCPQALNFEEVDISEKSIFTLLVSNLSKFSMEVNCDLTGPRKLLQYLEAKPQNAMIKTGSQLQLSLSFCPQTVCSLKNVILSIKVKHGPTFSFAIQGRAVAPRLELSFTEYNFGKCFLYRPGMVPASQTLEISNKGKRDISVQLQFKNTSCFEVDFQPDILSPDAMIKVPIKFYPYEACHYHEKLTFILNNCVTEQVDIVGQGIKMKLEVEDPRQRKLKLGNLMIGQIVEKQVVLVNHSLLDLSFTLELNINTALDTTDLSVSPDRELTLKASGGSCKVKIQFSPSQHIPPYHGELQARFAGLLLPLLTIQGSCQGKIQLNPDHLAFGAVVQCCKAERRIVLMNSGLTAVRFQWRKKDFPPELDIAPAKGHVGPGMEITCDVTFAPVELSHDIRYENLSCVIEGSASPVTFTVTGSCVEASTRKEVVNFVCPVRGSYTQALPVFNPTNQQCCIRPAIEGEDWSAAPSVTLEPLQHKTYEITYRPLTMTTDGVKHQGSVFFSFPDGTATLYSLQGTAGPPRPEDTIMRKLPAKTHHMQLLPVHNWLSKQQRFHVQTEILKLDKLDATVSLRGPQYIDVSASAKKDYELSFYTYKEGQYNTKVTFLNPLSGEYLYYLVTFEATSPGILSTIELVTAVRQTASATVQVENPLSTSSCLTTTYECAHISAAPQLTVPGQSKGCLSIEYQPLHAGESTEQLTLHSDDLGYFHYNLLLKALPPPPEKTVHFSTALGSSHSIPVKFTNYCHVKAKFVCKTDSPDFTATRFVDAAPGFPGGSEASVEVCFEPHEQGEVIGELCLSSQTAGKYIFPLHGICLPPKPQGPFSLTAGVDIMIPFKNVFLQTTTFSFQVDKPCFTVKGMETIPSKKTEYILVSFVPRPGDIPEPSYGKLTISCKCSKGHNKPSHWVFYLKGCR